MTIYKPIFLIIISLALSSGSYGQSLESKVICLTPTHTNRVNGVALGLWNRPVNQIQKINGINFELLGLGWLTPMLGLDDAGYTGNKQHTINGFSFGLSLLNGCVNGISISPAINTTLYFKGLKIGLLNFNLNTANGTQVAVVNLNNEDIKDSAIY